MRILGGNQTACARREGFIVAGLCIVAAIRVFIFSAAFPFFNNVDEQHHFDLVFKYSKGHLPASAIEKFDPNAAEIIVNNATGEFFSGITTNPPPGLLEYLKNQDNLETWAYPVYYMVSGLWCRLGILLGFMNTHLLYWMRFLNAPIMAGLVWAAYIFSRRIFPSSLQPRISIPILTAFFPQDIFFAITGDVLSPLVFALAFFTLWVICIEEKSWQYYLLAGFLVAITFLTKASNVAILPIAAVVTLIKIKQAFSRKQFRRFLPSVVVFTISAALPIALWIGRNYILFGDASGAAASIHARSWTIKPFGEMFNHPIFTFSGMFYFLTELTRTFWRGEFVWRFERIASSFMDWFYILSSAILITASVFGLVFAKKSRDKSYLFTILACLLVIIFSIVFLIVMSIRYDFGICLYPSREKPYFTSGRLIAGVTLPFIMLYIDGLRRILAKLRLSSFLIPAIIIIILAITISEIILTLPAFSSGYNWFHL